jgi:REP element-mobilizing transposase RayT
MNIFEKKRNSVIEFNQVYFWTATISKWRKLLTENEYKDILIYSMRYLSQANKIVVYGFVIMPNHIHIIWEMLEMNGKEKPYASFLKHTSHQMQKLLKNLNTQSYLSYNVAEITRKQRYWKRDPLAIQILSREMLQQKLEYCHNNPLQEHWNLATIPEDYYYSSAYDYLNNFSRFTFLKHYFDRVCDSS